MLSLAAVNIAGYLFVCRHVVTYRSMLIKVGVSAYHINASVGYPYVDGVAYKRITYSFYTRRLLCDCSLKPLDIEFMKRLHDKVNIIPLIAKADTLTPEECRDFKKTVSAALCSTYASF